MRSGHPDGTLRPSSGDRRGRRPASDEQCLLKKVGTSAAADTSSGSLRATLIPASGGCLSPSSCRRAVLRRANGGRHHANFARQLWGTRGCYPLLAASNGFFPRVDRPAFTQARTRFAGSVLRDELYPAPQTIDQRRKARLGRCPKPRQGPSPWTSILVRGFR